jgi:phenylacetate-coenzyme A ligase PaaK-like adenylate-forming protein
MLATGLAQLRSAASLIFGIPFAPWALDRLVDAALRTRHEFGALPAESHELVRGPALDELTRHEVQARRFRAQARRATRETAYYARLFAASDLSLRGLRFEDIAALPTTPKAALREDPDAFVRRDARPVFRSATTGTTGRPTCVSFSAHELRVYTALNAIGVLIDEHVGPEDIVHLGTSARATLGNACLAGACARVGAQVYLAGLVKPAVTLALLAEERHLPGKKPRASVLTTYPSYLGQLVEAGLRLGYRPADFGLERISVGGEVVTAGLKSRAKRLFGPVTYLEGYGMTELWPLGATRCEAGHLHHEPQRGLLEVLDPETRAVAAPGAVGTLVGTPFAPFRETTLVLRYDTEDLVRAVAGPLTCRLHQLPATSDMLGKRPLAVRHAWGWTTPRDVLEALEALEAVPLPARCGFRSAPGGVAVEVLVRQATPAVRAAVGDSLERHGVPLCELRLVEDAALLRRPLPLRGDLRELGFGPAPAEPVPLARTAAA